MRTAVLLLALTPEQMSLEPAGLPPDLARILRKDYGKRGPVIRASGFKPGS